MNQLPRKQIDIYEENMPAERAYRMYLEGRILFPRAPLTVNLRRSRKIADTLEEILMGLLLPPVYMSELQDGRLLVLDSSDMLKCLFDFLAGRLSCGYMELYPELEGYCIQRLEEEYPRITSILYNYLLQIQVIDYLTPKYLHMQVGNHVANWNFSREQGVRNALYGGKQAVQFLEMLSERVRKVDFFSGSGLNRQYVILRIVMYRLIISGGLTERYAPDMGLQLLLDQTLQILEKQNKEWLDQLAVDMIDVTDVIDQWNSSVRAEVYTENINHMAYGLRADRGKEPQVRKLGYFYNVVWFCREYGYSAEEGLYQISHDNQILNMIEKNAVNAHSIIRHWEMIRVQLK